MTKSYVYANAQPLAMHVGDYVANPTTTPRYFYLHDRLGSVRMVINQSGSVENTYTYNPFGEDITSECTPTASAIDNPWKFTGQYHDKEIGQYYLRARQYDPHTARFTGRDPINGDFQEPMTLHAYMYCLNDPVNRWDLSGEFSFSLSGLMSSTAIRSSLRALNYTSTGVYIADNGMNFIDNITSGMDYRNAMLNLAADLAIDGAISYAGGKIAKAAFKGIGVVGSMLLNRGVKQYSKVKRLTRMISGKADDWINKGFHMKIDGTEVKLVPGNNGTIKVKKVFSTTAETAFKKAEKEAQKFLNDEDSLTYIYSKALEMRNYLGTCGHAGAAAKSGELNFLLKAIEKKF